jgi:Flp pilus assembly protein TadD
MTTVTKRATRTKRRNRFDAFISHSSKNLSVALSLEQSLASAGIRVWVDHENLRAGGLLLDALQEALAHSRNLVLLWSKPASTSRYVSAEWQAAFHLEKGIIPCRLDNTDLPPFLLRLLFCDFRVSFENGATQLMKALGGKPSSAYQPQPQRLPRPTKDRATLIETLYVGQNQLLEDLQTGNLRLAARQQRQLSSLITPAVREHPQDPTILNLAGYHQKNAYLIRHWDDVQQGKSPQDRTLAEAEKLFFAALAVRPNDPSALNGLGSTLALRGDLDAAEFFVRRALAQAQEEHSSYAAAEHDLQLIQRLKKERHALPAAKRVEIR